MIAEAYKEEQAYLKDKLNGIDTSLPGRLAKYGFTLDEYQANFHFVTAFLFAIFHIKIYILFAVFICRLNLHRINMIGQSPGCTTGELLMLPRISSSCYM